MNGKLSTHPQDHLFPLKLGSFISNWINLLTSCQKFLPLKGWTRSFSGKRRIPVEERWNAISKQLMPPDKWKNVNYPSLRTTRTIPHFFDVVGVTTYSCFLLFCSWNESQGWARWRSWICWDNLSRDGNNAQAKGSLPFPLPRCMVSEWVGGCNGCLGWLVGGLVDG